MKLKDVFEATVSTGGCIYVPSYYWYQSETQRLEGQQGTSESILVQFEFESGSQFVDELMKALDEGILE